MKLSKILAVITGVTLTALIYVWQQTEIFRLAYVGQKRQAVFQELLDKKGLLLYNINKKASITHIANKFAEAGDFQLPDTFQLVKLTPPGEGGLAANRNAPKKVNIVANFFGIKREASAKTIGQTTSPSGALP